MENINFSLNEIEINKCVSVSDSNQIDDMHLFFGCDGDEDGDDEYDIEQLKLYYNSNYTIKGLSQILQYYGVQKNKMVKEEMIQVLLFFETDEANKPIVKKRVRLWQYIRELKADPYFSKYILF